MKRILLLGASGFVGRNIIDILKKNFDVTSPSRKELELRNTKAVEEFVKSGKYDVIVNCANPNPVKNETCDSQNNMAQDSLRIFMNFYRMSEFYNKMIYLGSGAEFNKQYEIKTIKESDITSRVIPEDVYGCTKYTMNELAQKSENIYNLRLFACYGPYDHESKFITHCIRCCLRKEPITIRQNCMFDYLHVYDLARIISQAIDTPLEYHDYNVASGRRASLEEIAQIVKREMSSLEDIKILTPGWNKEYTPDISRLNELVSPKSFISLEQGIQMQIAHEKKYLLLSKG